MKDFEKCKYRIMVEAEEKMKVVLPYEERDLCSICDGYDSQCKYYEFEGEENDENNKQH